jgi:glucose/arabinose dehydrogenase
MVRFSLLALLLVILAACGGDDASPAPQSSAAQSSASNGGGTPQPSGSQGSPASTDATGPLPEVGLQRVFQNVSFTEPTGLYQAPDGRWFATEQAGRVLSFEDRQDASASVVLDIRDKVSDAGNEEGLLGMALAPDFSQSGALYLYYSVEGGARRTRIARVMYSGTQIDRGSEQVLLEVDQPFANHNGGQLAFGPDGFLYVGLGDGGSGNDPFGNAQNLGVLLGKVLRLGVSRSSAGLAYAIPPDNPFAGQDGARGEIWAYGLRNPWRFSFDKATGALWVGDVGQNAREEVDFVTKGANLGWPLMEGATCRPSARCDDLVPPVIDYPTSGGNCAVTGGFVYRGTALPQLAGAYVYGDYCSGRVWALRYDGTRVTEQRQVADLGSSLSTFAQGNDGELYALAYGGDGGLYKLVAP